MTKLLLLNFSVLSFLENPELDTFERSDIDDRSVAEDLAYKIFTGGQTGQTGFADQDDVIISGQDCSAKVFNALRRCYRQPVTPDVSYNKGEQL